MDVCKRKKCEGCGLKVPHFGLPAEGRARWCSGCAKGHAGAVDDVQRRTQAGGSPQKKRKATGPPLAISDL